MPLDVHAITIAAGHYCCIPAHLLGLRSTFSNCTSKCLCCISGCPWWTSGKPYSTFDYSFLKALISLLCLLKSMLCLLKPFCTSKKPIAPPFTLFWPPNLTLHLLSFLQHLLMARGYLSCRCVPKCHCHSGHNSELLSHQIPSGFM